MRLHRIQALNLAQVPAATVIYADAYSTSIRPPALQGGASTISCANAPGITYGAEASTDLINWTPITDAGTGGQHVFSVPTTGQTRLFIRLNVQ
jgi:hypothetical protein